MKTHHITDEEICLYVDALNLNTTEQLPPAMVDHVADCGECKKAILQLQRVLRDENPGEAAGHPYFGHRRTAKWSDMSLAYRMAAVIVVALSVALIAWLLIIRSHTGPVQYTQAPPPAPALKDSAESTTPAPPDMDTYAANFQPSANMEDLLGSKFRSASTVVESPAMGEKVNGEVTFRWKGNAKNSYRLRILTNREKELFNTVTHQTAVSFSDKLDPGLYYWTLQQDGTLVYVGRFVVNVR